MNSRNVLIGLAFLTGCGPGTTTVPIVEGFGFGWNGFNHRLSHWEFGVFSDDLMEISVVGGTSTTGIPPEIPDTCDPETCAEFPFFDTPTVRLDWAEVTLRGASARGTAEFAAGAEGGSGEAVAGFDGPTPGDPVAIISAISIDTDHLTASGREECYNPAYGWHPTRIAVSLGDPVQDGKQVRVPVEAFFTAGNSLEEERACVDAINEQALAAVRVDVAVIFGTEAEEADLDQAMAYPWNGDRFDPDPQPAPDPADRPLPFDGVPPAVGWSAIDWRFHIDDPEGRGAYLRDLSFFADVTARTASGHATNYSPATQLSAFDYTFQGTVVAIGRGDTGVTSRRGRIEKEIPIVLDEAGRPVPEIVPR